MAHSGTNAPRAAGRSTRAVEIHLGGRCDLVCAVCDCRQPATTNALGALDAGGDRVVFRGAAETSPGFRDAVRTARARGFADIVVRTNGLQTMTAESAAAFATLGVHAALVPLFSSVPAVHDRIAGRPDALVHALVGMRALAGAGLALEIEIPLLSPKIQDVAALIRLAHRAVPDLRAARFFVSSERTPASLAPPNWDDGGPALAEAVRACRELGVGVSLRGMDGIPLCALRDAPDTHDAYRFDPRSAARLVAGSTHGTVCDSCAVAKQCAGLAESYRGAHGERGLVAYAHKPREMYAQRSAGSPVFTKEHRRAAGSVEMLVLRPTVNCNQDCPFCSANETSGNVWTSPDAMLRAISRAARRGVKRVSFSGGEPTLSRDLVHYVDAANRLGIEQIEIVTNGVLLDNPARVRALRDAGLTHAFVSLHAHDERISRGMTQKLDDHRRTAAAIRHLVDANVDCVINHVITSRNAPYLARFVEFVRAEFGGRARISFAFVTPQYKALEDLSLLPRISDVMPELRRAMYRALDLGQSVVVGSRQGIPPCVLGEFAGWSDVLNRASEAAAEDAPQKQRAPGCDECKYTRQCTGLWRQYVAVHGVSELSPLRGAPFTDEQVHAIIESEHPWRWSTAASFEGLPPEVRDVAREQSGRAAYESARSAPETPVRALPIVATQRSRPIRVALVGSGRQAQRLARAALNVTGLSIDALVSPSAPERPPHEFGGCPRFRTLDEAIDGIRPEAVIIAAATHAHHALASTALSHHIPTLLEKPLTRTETEAEDLVRIVREHPGSLVLPAHTMLFASGVREIVDAADLPIVSFAKRCRASSPDALRAWSRSGLYELLFHSLTMVGRAAGGGVPHVTSARHQGEDAPVRIVLELAYPRGSAEITFDFGAASDEVLFTRLAQPAVSPAFVWRRAGATTSLRRGDRDLPVPRDGSDLERMLAHFRDVVLQRAEPFVTPDEALDVMRAARLAVAALESAGAPFDRPNAPRHVASTALVAFPPSSRVP